MNRRSQPAVTLRSSKVVDLLKELTKNGKSQVSVVEEALERVTRDREESLAAARARIREAQDIIASEPRIYASMAEFDAAEYDEDGLPR